MQPLNAKLNSLDIAYFAHLLGYPKAESFFISTSGLPNPVQNISFLRRFAYKGVEHALLKQSAIANIPGGYQPAALYTRCLLPVFSYSCLIQVITNQQQDIKISQFFWSSEFHTAAQLVVSEAGFQINALEPGEIVRAIVDLIGVPQEMPIRSATIMVPEDVVPMKEYGNLYYTEKNWNYEMLINRGITPDSAKCLLDFHRVEKMRGSISFKTNQPGVQYMEDIEKVNSSYIFVISADQALGLTTSLLDDHTLGHLTPCTLSSLSSWLAKESKSLCFNE